jgi:hypothetical protein
MAINRLYVTRDNTTSGGGLWWCVWAVPGESISVGAEGYCSRKMFRTRCAASADAAHRWGEVPTYWPDRLVEAPAPKREA